MATTTEISKRIYRDIGTVTTQPASGENKGEILINACACIEKIMKAAEAKTKEQPQNDFTGSKKAQNMRSARKANSFKALVKAYEIGRIAKAVYLKLSPSEQINEADFIPQVVTDNSVGKWKVASDAEVKQFGLKRGKKDLLIDKRNDDGELIAPKFKAEIYIPTEGRFCYKMPAVISFRGTIQGNFDEAVESWMNNGKQGMDFDAVYYEQAVMIGTNLKGDIVITGHSLGGGMASACSRTSGKECWHFNAAGLHPNTVFKYSKQQPKDSTAHAYRHIGEILTRVQEDSNLEKGVLMAAFTVILGPIVGGYLSGKLGRMPKSYRNPDKAYDIKPIQLNLETGVFKDVKYAVYLHGMSETLESFRDYLRKLELQVRKELGVECKSWVVE